MWVLNHVLIPVSDKSIRCQNNLIISMTSGIETNPFSWSDLAKASCTLDLLKEPRNIFPKGGLLIVTRS